MSPRTYNLGKRRVTTQETRDRIIEAARRLLEATDGISAFTIDAVAREASVSRMTLYYQFGSKTGLLDALYNDLAGRGLVPSMPAAMQTRDPVAALDALVRAFCRFWANDRVITRRVRALAALDPEVEVGIRERDGWRRGLFSRVVGRLVEAGKTPEDLSPDELTDTVLALASFSFFDQLAETNSEADATSMIVSLTRSVCVANAS